MDNLKTLQPVDLMEVIGYHSRRIANLEKYTRSNKFLEVVVGSAAQNTDFIDLSEAIDFVTGKGGGKINLRKGTYPLTTQKVIPSNTEIEGESVDETIIDYQGGANSELLLGPIAGGGHNIKLRGFTIKNCQSTLNEFAVGSFDSDYIEISDIKFQDNSLSSSIRSLWFTSCSNIEVKNCKSLDDDIFAFVDGMVDIGVFYKNDIEGCKVTAFQGGNTGSGGGQCSYEKNTIASLDRAFYGRFDFGWIVKNLIFFNTTPSNIPFDLSSADELVFADNNAELVAKTVIKFIGAHRAKIKGNEIFSDVATTPAVIIQDSFNPIVRGNTLAADGSGQSCVSLVNVDQGTFGGNAIYGSGTGTAYGIVLDANSDFNNIVGNVLFGNTADTLDGGSGNLIDNNV